MAQKSTKKSYKCPKSCKCDSQCKNTKCIKSRKSTRDSKHKSRRHLNVKPVDKNVKLVDQNVKLVVLVVDQNASSSFSSSIKTSNSSFLVDQNVARRSRRRYRTDSDDNPQEYENNLNLLVSEITEPPSYGLGLRFPEHLKIERPGYELWEKKMRQHGYADGMSQEQEDAQRKAQLIAVSALHRKNRRGEQHSGSIIAAVTRGLGSRNSNQNTNPDEPTPLQRVPAMQ